MKKVFILFAVLVVIKAVLSSSFPSPWVFGDSAIYTAKTRAILSEGNFNFDEYHYGGPKIPPLYSIFLIPAYLFDDAAFNHSAILIINAILISLVIFPAYLLAKKFTNESAAVWTAFFVSFYPSLFGYPFTVMSENLFIPLFLVSAYLFYETLVSRKPHLEALMGLSLASLYLTRIMGVFPILIWLAYTLWGFLKERDRPQYLRNKLIALLCILIPIALWFIIKDSSGASRDITGYNFKDYLNTALQILGSAPAFIKAFSLFLHQLAFLNIATLFIPIPLIIGFIFLRNREQKDLLKKLAPILIYLSGTLILFLGVSVLHQYIFSEKLPERYSVFGRYIESAVPLLAVIAGVIWFSLNSKLFFIRRFGYILVFFIVFVCSLKFLPVSYYDIVNNVPILYFRGRDFLQDFPVLWILISLIAVFFFIYPSKILKRIFLVLLLAIWLFTYAPAFKLAKDVSHEKFKEASGAHWINNNLPKDTVIGFDKAGLWETGTIQGYWLFEFWLGKNYHLKMADESEPLKYFLSIRDLPYKQLFGDSRMRLYEK